MSESLDSSGSSDCLGGIAPAAATVFFGAGGGGGYHFLSVLAISLTKERGTTNQPNNPDFPPR